MIKKIAILTSGGDAPGMNNAIIGIVKKAFQSNLEPYLVIGGYKGLHDGNFRLASEVNVEKYINVGGTFILSSRYPEFKDENVRKEALEQVKKFGIDALVVIGGDGSYKGAQLLSEAGLKTIALPGTIDNDIASSDYTIGYDTALNTIVENVDRVRDTMRSHSRASMIEVMGHGCDDLAIFSGLATGAEIIITSKNKMTKVEIANKVKSLMASGKDSVIILVSEFIYEDIETFAKEIDKMSGIVTRGIKFAHIQRGGTPSASERYRSMLMGIKAVELLIQNKTGLAIGIVNDKVVSTPIAKALSVERVDRTKLINEINAINGLELK